MTCTRHTRLIASQDSHVKQFNPDQRVGRRSRLLVSDNADHIKIAYIKFDINRRKWKDATIISATFRIHVPVAWSSQEVTIQRITQRWKENRINYTNRPTSTVTNQVIATVSAAANGAINFDIGDIFLDWVDNNKAVYGVLLETDETSDQPIYSSEARHMYRPELLIVWS